MKFASALLALLFCTPLSAQDNPPIVRVFVLAGQSNMQGQAVVDMDHPEHYNGGKGNLNDVMIKSKGRFDHLKSTDGWSDREDVKVRYQTEKQLKRGNLSIGFSGYEDGRHFGPELQFGHVVGDYLEEPVLLIKTAWGGKSLSKDFRPPSAVRARGGEVGPYYQKMMQEVSEALSAAATDFPEWSQHRFEISGFVWQQGWNDMVNEKATGEYFKNLVDLIDDVRSAWNRPNLPVVVGELGNDGPDAGPGMKRFRRQQARIDAHGPFVSNVIFVPTAQHARPASESPNTGHGHHWYGNAESYLLVGESLGLGMVELLGRQGQPKILILGDSISIGYTSHVKKSLKDSAFVTRPMRGHRAAENCEGTDKGITAIDRWLAMGDGQWDVIHFNFGLHDLKRVNADSGKNSNNADDPYQSDPEAYKKQLQVIVEKLKQTGAHLIFATTTPVPTGVKPYRAPSDPATYNQIAREIMTANGIEINDLYSFAAPRLEQIQIPANVHFTAAGSQQLGGEVTKAIKAALDRQ